VIRSGNQGTNLVAVQHSVNDFHNWASEIDVRFGDGYIQVWSLSNDLEIIAYNSNDIQQSEMREFMVSSGWGASGDWTITEVSCSNGCYDVPITQYTPNTYNYISMLSGMDERFVTSVRLSFQNNQPNNDRHIALAQEATHNSAKWEIVLGGWRGRQSVIRSGNQGTNLVAVQHSVNDFHNWASEIDVRFGDGYIQVWSLSNDLEIIAYNSNDIQQSEMREFMVSSGWGASGDWTITGVSCNNVA